ncbi:conserved hypothetical protein [Rippkaea orientalis PCC 8801]|uniref:Glycosyltransferase n=1 Tax=Rippkaea orientalis (strain PCC 8801 / RF-1) TaxID=41431 RepID=B7K045_RIPO1|nr:TIGR04282 family arsenosugar biosynthesis glycosyltransferase [Rippkaea orientalis]ACK66192.1 conserved hypothetical protein [Rippkaea orientalis PCC 8801]
MLGTNCDRLIIFTRYPEPGKTKTRLISSLGAKGAARLQRQLTEHTLKQVNPLINQLSFAIYYNGNTQEMMKNWLGNDLSYYPQPEGDLGQKMQSAFADSFNLGYTKVVIIGIDCPALNSTIVQQAFNSLNNHDLVLGKAADGGYYLIGLKQIIPQLFKNIPWGTNQVLSITQTIAEKLNLTYSLLRTLSDIDRPEDLPILKKYGILE